MSKGSKRRQQQVSQETFDSNWDAVFKKKTTFKRYRCAQCNTSYTEDNSTFSCTVCGSAAIVLVDEFAEVKPYDTLNEK